MPRHLLGISTKPVVIVVLNRTDEPQDFLHRFFPIFSRCQGMRTWAWRVTWRRSPVPEARIRKFAEGCNFSIYLSTYLSIHPSIHLSIYLSMAIGKRPEVAGSSAPALSLNRLIHNTYTVYIYNIYIYTHQFFVDERRNGRSSPKWWLCQKINWEDGRDSHWPSGKLTILIGELCINEPWLPQRTVS